MDTVDSDSALTDLGISTASDIPFSPLFTPGDDLSRPSGYADHAFYDQTEPEINPEVYVPRLQKGQTSKVETMLIALEGLREARILVMDLLLSILGGEFSEFYSHRLAFLCDTPQICKVLDIFWEEKNSRLAMLSWFQDEGINYICKLVSNEMEAAKPMLRMKVKDVSPDYIENWDLAAIVDPVAKITPMWTKILMNLKKPNQRMLETGQWYEFMILMISDCLTKIY